jgi:TolB-like protein/tetratricopeptide (TPR) repeat protein
LAELRRRNVLRAAALYIGAAWALSQGLAQLLPVFDVANWVTRWFIVAAVIGFPFAMLASWFYEWTPEGLKRESDVDLASSVTRQTGKALDRWITASLILVVVLLLTDRFVVHKEDAAIPEKSIAVLPFENLSGDPENAYFVDGIQDEILTRLAKIADLKVISRTSTQRFRSSPQDLPQIARQLGVRNILEGSVQREPGAVRVNVQLINAATDAHLWADIYDHKITDIFSVESEIAGKIAASLEARLSGSEKRAITSWPTDNTAAHQLFLKGLFFWNKRTGNDLKAASDYFQQATVADPAYAAAYAGLAQAKLLIPVFGAGAPGDYFPAANAAASRAIELDPESAEGHAALGQLLTFDWKFAEAEQEFLRAINLNPNYATAHHWYGNTLLVSLGRFDEAIRQVERAVELDPLSLIINADLGGTLILARRYDEAIAQLHRTLALDANFSYAHWNLGMALYLKGDKQAAVVEYEKAAALGDDPEILVLLGRAYGETGRRDKAEEILKNLENTAHDTYLRNYLFAVLYIGLGEKDKAVDSMESAASNHENYDTNWMKVDPLLDPLRDDPRFRRLQARLFHEDAE